LNVLRAARLGFDLLEQGPGQVDELRILVRLGGRGEYGRSTEERAASASPARSSSSAPV
jgi:hypothetical protein